MDILYDILFILGIRFWLFDSSMFKGIRKRIYETNSYILIKLTHCSFCQGFWIGLIYYLWLGNEFFDSMWFGFISAICSLTWYCLTDDAIRKMESQGK